MDKKSGLVVLDEGALAGVRGGDCPFEQPCYSAPSPYYGGFSPSASGYGIGTGGQATAVNNNTNVNTDLIDLMMGEEERRGLLW